MKHSLRTLFLLVILTVVAPPVSLAGAISKGIATTDSSSHSLRLWNPFQNEVIRCGPQIRLQTPEMRDLGFIVFRSIHREVRGVFSLFQWQQIHHTIAYETTVGTQKISGVLDFYRFDDQSRPQVSIQGNHLAIHHSLGTHLIPWLRLFSNPPPTMEASSFYPQDFTCID